MPYLSFFKRVFIVAALWNLTGAIFGYFNTAFTFEATFNRELTDPLMYAVYRGAWGTTLIYFIGYLIVASNPEKHYGIVITGGIGKVGYVINLIQLYLAGLASPIVFIIVIGDAIFFLIFMVYFYQIYLSRSVATNQLRERAPSP